MVQQQVTAQFVMISTREIKMVNVFKNHAMKDSLSITRDNVKAVINHARPVQGIQQCAHLVILRISLKQ